MNSLVPVIMEKQTSEKRSRVLWADLNDSFSSTEAGNELSPSQVFEEEHPETQILLDLLPKKNLPLTIYLNNLPYDLHDSSQILDFLGLFPSERVSAGLLIQEGKPSGKGTVTVSTYDLADTVLRKHGNLLAGRHVYMSLDSFFGRGKHYLKQLKARNARFQPVTSNRGNCSDKKKTEKKKKRNKFEQPAHLAKNNLPRQIQNKDKSWRKI